MRNCPSCHEIVGLRMITEYNATSVINSGGETPNLSLYKCVGCGMHYVDCENRLFQDVTQSWFDHYYLTYYKTDDKPFSDARLESLAECVSGYCNHFDDIPLVLDIGGMDGELAKRLATKGRGIDTFLSGVGDSFSHKFYIVILSHTLEHIYDVPAMFERIKAALVPGGLLFIEVPVWLTYDDLTYDNHWQHINKFRSSDLENILKTNGFDVILSTQIEDYREYNVWRIIGRMK